MNEELKIIISAATKPAQDGINKVKKEFQGLEGAAGKGGGAMKGMGAKFAAAAGVAVVAIGAIVAAGLSFVPIHSMLTVGIGVVVIIVIYNIRAHTRASQQ